MSMRIIRRESGLEKPQNGIMTIDGVEMINADDAYYAEPSKRGLNLVFQSYALWPQQQHAHGNGVGHLGVALLGVGEGQIGHGTSGGRKRAI